MSGKALLILVVAFAVLFSIMGYYWSGLATKSVDNYVLYYEKTIAHNIAVSGANLALHEILMDSDWNNDISKDYESGYMNVSITPWDTTRLLVSEGIFPKYGGVKDTIKVKLMLSNFAKYAWWIAAVSTGSKNKRYWITGDTVWGSFHSDQFLNISGDPVFFGKVSVEKGLKMTSGSAPKFLGGLVTGVHVAWDQNMKLTQQANTAAAGASLGGTCNFSNENLWLTFNPDGTVTYRTAPKNADDDSSHYSTPITEPLSKMAPTGIIYLDKGDIYLSGILKGQVTVVSDQSSGNGGGNVYFVGDMTYHVNPMVSDGAGGYIPNDDCTDLMGIIATNNVNISSSVESGGYINNVVNKDLCIDAGIMSIKGGFNLIGLGSSPCNEPLGKIYLRGSMIAGKEENIATYNNNVVTAGYCRHIVLDERFLIKPPQYFPYSNSYEIISWLE